MLFLNNSKMTCIKLALLFCNFKIIKAVPGCFRLVLNCSIKSNLSCKTSCFKLFQSICLIGQNIEKIKIGKKVWGHFFIDKITYKTVDLEHIYYRTAPVLCQKQDQIYKIIFFLLLRFS